MAGIKVRDPFYVKRSLYSGGKSRTLVCGRIIMIAPMAIPGAFSQLTDLLLVALAFAGSIGMTFVILGCALPQYGVWWPFFVVLLYLLAPVPTLIARRHTEDATSSGSSCLELCIFITMGFVVSAFALPIVLARSPVIEWGACYLTLIGNAIVFITLLGFFLTFDQEDADYSMW